MQPLARDGLSDAAVRTLLTADSVTIAAGLDLLDASNTVVGDLTAELVGGSVERDNYAAVHGSCRLQISRALVWGKDRVRPYVTLSRVTGYDDVTTVSADPMPYDAMVQRDGPLAYWRLGETEGATFADLSGNGYDASRDGNCVHIDDGPIQSGANPVGGTRGGGAVASGLPETVDAFTVAMWIRAQAGSTATYYEAFCSRLGGGVGWLIQREVTNNRLYMRLDTSGGVNQTGGHMTALDGRWHHVVYTVDRGTRRAYLDGALVQSGTYLHGAGFNTGGLAVSVVGGEEDRAEVAIFPRALTAAEVADHYYAGFADRTDTVINLIPNPSVETNTANWSYALGASGSATYTRETSGGYAGSCLARLRMTTSGAVGGHFMSSLAGTVLGGQVVSAGVWVRSSVAKTMQLTIEFKDAAGGLLLPDSGPTVSVPANQWTRLTHVDRSAPAGTDRVTLTAYIASGTWASGNILDADAAMLVKGSTLPDYFDGATTGTATYEYAWTGTAHASQSTRTAISSTTTREPVKESARFNLGVYVLTTPDTKRGEDPITYDVAGFDLLHLLQDGPGDTYTVTAGTTYVQAIRDVVTASGIGAPIMLDGTRQDTALPATMVWALTDAGPSWLSIINDLLAAIGYIGIWADETGNLRSGPFVDPADRPSEWLFDTANTDTNIVGVERVESEDLWGAPNHWRFVRSRMATQPVEGDGIYTVQNLGDGPTSQASLGRIVRKVVFLDAADQTTLVAQGDKIVSEDRQVAHTFALTIDPLPALSHRDVVTLVDATMTNKLPVATWTVNLDGSPGSLNLGDGKDVAEESAAQQATATVTQASPLRVVVDGATVSSAANALDGATYLVNDRVTVTVRNPLPPLIQGVEGS